MHTGEPIVVDRGGTSGRGVVVYVPRTAVNVYGTIQPGILRKAMKGERTSAGLFARLLIVAPPWRAKRSSDVEVSQATSDAWADLLGSLANRPMMADADGEPTPHFVGLTREARRVFDRWADLHNASAEGEPDNVASAIAKLEGYALRFALLFGLVESADPIGIEHVRRGCALAEWFANEARRVYTMASEDEVAAGQRELCEWAARRGPAGVTASDLATSGPRVYRGRPDEADAALVELEAAGFGTYAYPPARSAGGRPTRRFIAHAAAGGGI